MDKFLRLLHRRAMAMKDPSSLAELVEAVDLAEAAITRDGWEKAARRGWPER